MAHSAALRVNMPLLALKLLSPQVIASNLDAAVAVIRMLCLVNSPRLSWLYLAYVRLPYGCCLLRDIRSCRQRSVRWAIAVRRDRLPVARKATALLAAQWD